jgi:SNF family Na+-dependent transporter
MMIKPKMLQYFTLILGWCLEYNNLLFIGELIDNNNTNIEIVSDLNAFKYNIKGERL